MPKRRDRAADRERREREAREALAAIDARSERGPGAFEAFKKTVRRVASAKPLKQH